MSRARAAGTRIPPPRIPPAVAAPTLRQEPQEPAAAVSPATIPFLATAPARKVHAALLARLASFAATAQGRERLRALPFLPDPAACLEAMQAVLAGKARVASLDQARVRSLLARLEPVTVPPPRQVPGRLVACESADVLDRWESRGLHRHVRLCGAEGLRQSDGYDLVVWLYDEGMDVDAELAESVVEVAGDAPLCDVAPEAELHWFEAHRGAIAAAAELAVAVGGPSCAAEALVHLEEARRADTTPKALRRHVAEVRAEVESRVREASAGITLSGADVLQSLGRRLPPALQQAVDAALAHGARQLQERTGCSFQPYVAGDPVGIDDDEVEAVERTLAARGHADAFRRLVRCARALCALRPRLEAELERWRDFEVRFALGAFALHHDLQPATFGDGFSFASSVHLDLAARPAAQRVAYRLGGPHPIALLTGANSGGKSTLLEHLLQLAAMARMGLPVVGAGVEVPWIDEVHYVTARRSLDAGAFESFLKAFLPVAIADRRRLVLADEVEAVTEAEAAARILGCVLDHLAGSGSLAVVVSHMAPQVLAHTSASVRIDGIEATGLDARNRLVVDRSPRLGVHARSTPEIIVQRLAATTKGPVRELCGELLARLQAPAARRRPPRDTAK